MRLKGKTVLITEATSGIGLATAELFLHVRAHETVGGQMNQSSNLPH